MPADRGRGRGGQGRTGARLYSVTMVLALCGLALNLALGQWLLAIPFAVLLLDAPAPRRSKILSGLIGLVAVVAGVALQSWLVLPIASLFFLSHSRASSATMRAVFPEVSAGDLTCLSEAIRAGYPPRIASLPRARGETLTTRALLDAAIAADPGRWAGVKLTEPRTLSAEGGEVAGTGWTVVAGEAALVAMNLPNATLPVTIHELAVAAMLLPGSNVQRTLGDEDRAVVLTKVAGLSEVNATQALTKASRAPGGGLLTRRARLVLADRDLAKALPVGDWRESRNPLSAVLPKAAPSAGEGTAEPPGGERPASAVPAAMSAHGPVPQASRNTATAGAGTDAPTPTPAPRAPNARRRRRKSHPGILNQAVLAWRSPARVLWWGLRPLGTIVALVACCLAPWRGAYPLLAATAALAVLVIRPARHLWVSIVLAAAVALLSPVAGAAVAGRTIVTFAALWLNGPGWRAGLSRLAQSRREMLGVPDLQGAWLAIEQGLTRPGDLKLFEGLIGLAGATWSAVDAREYPRQGWLVVRGLLGWHWPFGRVPATEALLLQMALVESVVSRLVQVLAATLAGLLALLVFPVDPLDVFGHDISRLIAVVIAVVVSWPRAALRGETNLTFRPESNTPRAISAWVPVAVWLAIVLVAGYFAIGTGGLWITAASLAIGMAAGLASTRLTRPALAPRPTVPQLPVSLRWRKGHDIWDAARAALAAGDPETARRIWRQQAADPATNRQVSALAKAMLAGLALDQGAWQEAVEWSDLSLRGISASSSAGYLTRTVAARVMLAAGTPDRAVELIDEAEAAGHQRRVRRDPVTRMVLARALATVGDEKDIERAIEVLSQIRAGVRGAEFGPMMETEALVAAMSPPGPAAVDRLKSMLEWVDSPSLSASLGDRARLDTAAAWAWLALGDLELRLGKPAEAEPALRRALNSFPSSELMNRATAQVLLGCAIVARGQADGPLRYIETGLAGLEEARGQLRDSFLRSRLVIRLDDVYTRALDALVILQWGAPGAGEVAAVLLESLRRDALAMLLRDGEGLRLDPETRAIQREIAELEKAGQLTSEQVKEREALRERLSVKMSAIYADAYAPVTVTMPDLRRRASGADILTFKIARAVPECLQAYSVWIPAGGEPLVRAITITDPQLLEAIGLLGRGAQQGSMGSSQIPGKPAYQLWVDLGGQLLPDQLTASLADRSKGNPLRLLVVPDGILAAFPWAGLRTADGRHLIEVASIQVTPAVGILPERPAMPLRSAPRGVADDQEILLHRYEHEEERELAMLSAIGDVRLTQDRTEIEAVLSEGGVSGAYFSTHGDGDGLDQVLVLNRGGQISAASALTMAWPSWLIFASCIVGTMRITAGSEPTGLVTSCLLGGAASVIAGVVEVDANVADRFCVSVASRISRGQHPADALRDTQLAFYEGRDTAPVDRWAGYICVSTIPPSHVPIRESV